MSKSKTPGFTKAAKTKAPKGTKAANQKAEKPAPAKKGKVANGEAKTKKVSAIDAAAQMLAGSNEIGRLAKLACAGQ